MTQPRNPFRYFDASLEVIQECARVNNDSKHPVRKETSCGEQSHSANASVYGLAAPSPWAAL